ncbi:MAG: group 1 glycosyl transferase, partial [Alphaproteobacteria bacterium]
MPKLLVLIPDRISEILAKGEYQPLYYNPGEVFDEVHIVSTTPDTPDLNALQRTVGKAQLRVHTHPDNLSIARRWPGMMQRFALRRWARAGVELARRIKPDLIRCHGADWNAYLASEI